MLFLFTEAGNPLNGTAYSDRAKMLEAVRAAYGPECDFAITEGVIEGPGEGAVATFGEAPGGRMLLAEWLEQSEYLGSITDQS